MVQYDECPAMLLLEGIERCHKSSCLHTFVERLSKSGDIVDEQHLGMILDSSTFNLRQHVVNGIVGPEFGTEEGWREVWRVIPQGQLPLRHLEVEIQYSFALVSNLSCHLHGKDGLADARLSKNDA